MITDTFKTPTFDSLPTVVNEMSRKIDRMERLIENLSPHKVDDNIPMDLDECSEFTGLAKPTIYSKCSLKEIPFHKKGKKLYFFQEELLDWIKKGKPHQSVAADSLKHLKIKKGGLHV